MQLVIVNLTGSARTYLSGTISVAGNSSFSVTNITQQISLSTDGQLRFDLFSNFAQITDGTNTYAANDALNYLSLIAQNTSYSFVSSPGAAAAGIVASVSSTGGLSISPPSGTLFLDAFDSSGLDTTNRWNLTLANGGTDTQSLGTNTLATTTAASSSVQLQSQPSFMPSGSFYSMGVYVQYEAVLQNNTHGFWGVGNPAVSFTAATPLSNASGFEIDSSGNLNAVMYSNGIKIFSTNLNSYKNSNPNLYVITYRADAVFFYINSFEVPVAVAAGYVLDLVNLPLRVHRVNGTTPPTSPTSLSISAAAVVDSNPNAVTNISDGNFGWRKLKVNTDGSINTTPNSTYQLNNGQLFSSSIQVVAITGNADNPLVLLRNPIGSGKTAIIKKILLNVEVVNIIMTYKVFAQPTLTNTVSTITNITQPALSGTVTVTTSAANGASVGATVVISGTTNFNGTYTVASVTSSTIYTYTTGATLGATNTSGTSTMNSSLGTSLASTPLKRTTSPTASIVLATSAPTVGSNGTPLIIAGSGQNVSALNIVDDELISLDAGQNLLVTGNPASNSRSCTVTIIWAEV